MLGRRAGTLPGFRFSEAMRAAGARGLIWTRESLDAYLADPPAFVPGTEMGMPPLADADDRCHVIDLLGGPDMAPQTPHRSGRPGKP